MESEKTVVDPEFLIFHVEGGLGKNVVSTVVVKKLKEKYNNSKLIVVASWPEVFISNPHIHEVYRIGNTPYFYNRFIKDKNSLIFRHEPYFESSHINKQTPLAETWCSMYDLGFDQNEDYPELFMNMLQKDIAIRWQRSKPVMVLQTNGGPLQGQKLNYSWTRDMPVPIAQSIVNHYSKDYHIIQVCREESQAIQGTEAIWTPMSCFELFSMLRISKKRILIDSCLQHAAAALRLSSVVLWIGTSPELFGYKLHNNVPANQPPHFIKLVDSYLFDYSFSGEVHECPYSDVSELFDINQIMETIDVT